ncbi:MAG: TonB-dependent receptor [Rhodoferax sp.]|nr:TonB-dependent receptor [Rhodoferax sp.]
MYPLRCFLGFFGVVTIASSGAAWGQTAQDEEDLASLYGDKAFISIATGSQQALRRAPAVASVITAADIAAMGATDLDAVLEAVPGLHVTNSPNLYASGYAIRGITTIVGPQTLILQNGVPITTLFIGNKGNIWGDYPVEHIARIEIIRGPGSALYGADAFSGVINIITKAAADTQGTEVGARAGSFNTRNVWVQHGGKLGVVDVAAYLRLGATDGIKETVTADAQSRYDRIFGTRATLAPGNVNMGFDAVDANLDLGYDKWRVRANYKLRDNMGTGVGIAYALDPVGRARSERTMLDTSWADARFAKDWGLGFTASYLQYTQLTPTDFQLFPPGANIAGGVSANGLFGGPDTWERQIRLSAYATYTGLAQHAIRIGLGHDDLDLYKTRETRNFTYSPAGALVPTAGGAIVDFSDTNPFMRPQHRLVDYVLVQDEWNFAKDWTLTAGVRRDLYSDFGGTTNPRLALVWDASLDLTAKLLAGRAFRAPAFNEAYSFANPVARGNPDLRPETIRTVELAFAWQARGDTQVNLSLFRYDMQDIIRLVNGAYANIATQNGQGGELEAVWDANRKLRLTGNYAWQRSTDEITQQDAGFAPRHHLYARAEWQFSGNWLASAQVNWVAERKRAPNDTRSDIADFSTLDLGLRTRNGRNQWDFAAAVRNLFNADVREPMQATGAALPNDLPMAPRSVYLQASYRM